MTTFRVLYARDRENHWEKVYHPVVYKHRKLVTVKEEKFKTATAAAERSIALQSEIDAHEAEETKRLKAELFALEASNVPEIDPT